MGGKWRRCSTASMETGMLLISVDLAADLVDESYDNGQLISMMEQAEEISGTKATMTLADSGYFAGSDLEECVRHGQRVVVSEARQKLVDAPYHKDRFVHRRGHRHRYVPPRADSPLCPMTIRQQGLESGIPGVRSRLPEVSGFRGVYLEWPLLPVLRQWRVPATMWRTRGSTAPVCISSFCRTRLCKQSGRPDRLFAPGQGLSCLVSAPICGSGYPLRLFGQPATGYSIQKSSSSRQRRWRSAPSGFCAPSISTTTTSTTTTCGQ